MMMLGVIRPSFLLDQQDKSSAVMHHQHRGSRGYTESVRHVKKASLRERAYAELHHHHRPPSTF